MKNKKLPETLEIVGLKHFINEDDKRLKASGYISEGSPDEQEIVILSTLPFLRRLSYLMIEVGHIMLLAAGVPGTKAKKLREPFGRCLFQLVKDNSFDWLYNADKSPTAPSIATSVYIHGLCYCVTWDADEHLDDMHFAGEINYRDLTIALHSTLPFHSAALVLCHEIVHGLLYESGCIVEQNNEKLVEPMGHFLYQLFTSNDFSFAYERRSADK